MTTFLISLLFSSIAHAALSAPVLNNPVPGHQQVGLTWSSVAGATGYKVTYQVSGGGGSSSTNFTNDAACVAAYVMDETSGNLVDLCGNNDPGTISGSVNQNVTGKYDKGIEFKGYGGGGNNAYVSFGSGSTLDNLAARTIVAWIKPDNLGDNNQGTILSKNYQDGWVLRLAAGNKVAFSQAFSGGVVTWTTTSSPIVLGAFQHIAVRYTAATTTTVPDIYVNGIKQTVSGGTPYGTRDNDSSFTMDMGILGTSYEFDGVIDEVGVFNRVLTETEVNTLMNGGLTGAAGGGSPATILDVANVTQYTVTGLTNNISYDFKVKAYSATEQGPDSVAKSATPVAPPPLVAPTVSDIVPGDQQVAVTWNTIAGASGYKVTYQNNGGTTTTTNFTQDAACVGAWTMNEASGNIVDLCGNNDTGTVSGNVLQNVTGKYGKGVEFQGYPSGNNAYVSFGSGATLDNLAARTIVAWIKPDSLGDSSMGVILSKDYQDGWVLRMASGNNVAFSQAFSGGVVTWTTTTNPISLGNFQHVAVRYSAATTATVPEIYVNGVKQTISGGTPFGSRDNDSTYSLHMGVKIDTQEFDGVIDEAAVFNRVLTEAELTELMNGGLAGSTQGGTTTTTVDVGNVTQKTVTGLTNGTKYDLKVKAYNVLEQGPDSAVKIATPHVPMEFVKNVDYNAAGQIIKAEYGNGTITTYTYDPLTLRLTQLKTTDKNNLVIQNLSYQYDSVGNIRSITDAIHSDSQTFQYDALHRGLAV